MRHRLILSLLCLLLLLPAAIYAQSGFDPASVADINLDEIPILPEITETAREIYLLGHEAGRSPHVFSKVGDCMTASPNFMVPFSTPDGYDLGEYPELQEAIDFFSADPVRDELTALSNPGLATTTGFTTVSVQDPIWADPAFCAANESPLTCEYRVSNPAFSLIMFGTNDTAFFEADAFNGYLRQIIDQTIEANIVPVLYTFPVRPEFPEKSVLFNQIIVQIAQEYDLPLINLYRVLEDLPDQGINLEDPIHLSSPIGDNAGNFTPANLERGYTMRNLITLQALDILYRDLIAGEDAPELANV